MNRPGWWTTLRAVQRRRAAAWIRRRQGADALPVTLQRRRIYILPTRAGLGFALLLLVMLVAGLNYANSIALFLTFVLAGLSLVSMHACHRNLLQVRINRIDTEPAFAGSQALVHLVLMEDAGLPRPDIRVDGDGTTGTVCDLPMHAEGRLELLLATPRRGLMPLGRVRITTTYPFGLFRAWTWLHPPHTITVYPAPAGARPMPIAPGARQGTHMHGPDADEWSGLRAWREGDSPRQVAWTVYARGLPLMVKEYSAAGSDDRLFDFAALDGAGTEQRLSQLARWILDAESAGARYALRLPGDRIQTGHGLAHRHRCLAALALYQPPARTTTPEPSHATG